MEARSRENNQTQVTTPFKRFSRTKYPTHEKNGEEAIRVKCTNNGEAGYQHFQCSECNKVLILEPLTFANVHVNLKVKKTKYSVMQIGAQCRKCKKTDMIKIAFNCESVTQPEKATQID